MSDEAKKIGYVVTMSNESYEDAVRISDIISGGIREMMRPKSPAELRAREIQDAKDREEWRKEFKKIADRHGQLINELSGRLREIAILHGPASAEYSIGQVKCLGCDLEGYEVEYPAFPCSTYRLITGQATP